MTVPCAKCGQPGFLREAVSPITGRVVAGGHLCGPCWRAALSEFAEFRRQFEELLALGVNRPLANEVIIARIDARRAT